MLMKYKPEDINPKVNSVEELKNLYYSFPNYKQRLLEFGILVFELE